MHGRCWRLHHLRRYAYRRLFFRRFLYSTERCAKKWTVLAMGSVAHFLQQGSLLVALSQLSATRYVQVSLLPSLALFADLFPDYGSLFW